MNRTTWGRVLLVGGLLVVVVGVVGMLADSGAGAPVAGDAPSPTATATTPAAAPSPTVTSTAAPSPTPTGAVLASTVDDPPDDVYACDTGADTTPEPRVDVVAAEVRETTTNPVSGADATSLLVTVRQAFAADRVGAQALVLLGPATVDAPVAPDDLHGPEDGVQVRMTYRGTDQDPPFAKTARRWDGDAWAEVPPDDWTVRFEGFDDHVEFEFYAPPGSTFGAALVTDTTTCDLVAP